MELIWEKKKFKCQGLYADCFAVAVINACIFKEMPSLSRSELKAIGKGFPIIFREKCLQESNIDYKSIVIEREKDLMEVSRSCGIITIMHPIFNLHSVFVFRKRIDDVIVYLVNSLLGPNVLAVSIKSLFGLLPEYKHSRKAFVIA